MKKTSWITLGVETSCDETSCAILEGAQTVRSNIVASSLAKHQPFGGVVPEIACRHHLETIDIVFKQCLEKAQINKEEIDLIAVTQGPGLIGALLVGMSFAKTLAFSLDKPLIGVNHLEAHLESVFIENARPSESFVGLVVSGGHTMLVHYTKKGYVLLGETRDDACGEAFDKVAKILDLGYPGGPLIDRLSDQGDSHKIDFPSNPLQGSLDFSFSGLKTAVLYYVQKQKNIAAQKADIAASFQRAAVESLVNKALQAAEKTGSETIVVGGGVSANRLLRQWLTQEGERMGLQVLFPSLVYSQDNGAMIARCGYEQFKRRPKAADWTITAHANLLFVSDKRHATSYK
jgi:N6-L-threonylcarbamoyladenine synthase